MTQTERVIKKFGSIENLKKSLLLIGFNKSASTLYRWGYGKSKRGTNGLIPSSCIAEVITAARMEGILLTEKDLDPRANKT